MSSYPFFNTAIMHKLEKISSSKILPIKLNEEVIFLNETGVSKEIYLLKKRKREIQKLKGDLEDDLSDEIITKEIYEQQRGFLQSEFKAISEQIKELEKNTPITTGFLLGSGGSKKFYELRDGKALMLPNLDATRIPVEFWQRIIKEESMIAEELSQYGLLTQTYERVTIEIEGLLLHTLKTESFAALANRGLEIRDYKNRIHYGNTPLFDEYSNINQKFILKLLSPVIDDIILLLKQQININGASFNLAVYTEPKTGGASSVTIAKEPAKIRLFLYDFSIREHSKLDFLKLKLLDENNAPLEDAINQHADCYLDLAISSVITAIAKEEINKLILSHPESASQSITRHSIYNDIERVFHSIKSEMLQHINDEVLSSFTSHVHPAKL